MPSSKNRIIIACAGSGKTTRLVTEALENRDARIAFVTYTNNNANEIVRRFGDLNSGVPKHVQVLTWYGFVLRELARPYQRSIYSEYRIESLFFVNQQSARGTKEVDTNRHYFAQGKYIYSDKLSKFVVSCEQASGHRVSARLNEIYTDIFIDEFQDLAGWDLELIECLLRSGIRITLVGDPRQHIYQTNPSNKNKQYLGLNVIKRIEQWKKQGLCSIDPPMSSTYRCNQGICQFVNELWPGMDAMIPVEKAPVFHGGVYLVSADSVRKYLESFNPQILRYNIKVKSYDRPALNYGASKGLEFDHVLIIPTKPIRDYLETGDLQHLETSKDKLHVAVTRAIHSVAFVYDGESPIVKEIFKANG